MGIPSKKRNRNSETRERVRAKARLYAHPSCGSGLVVFSIWDRPSLSQKFAYGVGFQTKLIDKHFLQRQRKDIKQERV